MSFTISNHLLTAARYIPSPNCNPRPLGMTLDLIVIHNISLPAGQFGTPYVEELFTNQLDLQADPSFASLKDLRVSAHLFLRRTGEILQFVAFDHRAWHAGVSSYQNRCNCNDFSIGIEVEGTDTEPYEPIQYKGLTTILRTLLDTYPTLSRERIVGHSDIAPGRKTDPGPSFDWQHLHALLQA